MGMVIAFRDELTIANRSSAIVGILDVAGARGTTQFASIENARNLDCAQVSDSVKFWVKDGTILDEGAWLSRDTRIDTPTISGSI